MENLIKKGLIFDGPVNDIRKSNSEISSISMLHGIPCVSEPLTFVPKYQK